MTMTIRDATPGDIPLLTRLIRDSFQDVAERFQLTPENAAKHPSNCEPAWVQSAIEKGVRYYLLLNADTPCGCVAIERANPEVCYLERLSVLPEFRKKGFGEALLRHAVAEARDAGACRIEIGIIAAQTDLRDWYMKFGFSLKNTVCFKHLPFEVAFMFKDIQASGG
jgi:N-acetylglutamate synthase-like GNAT family acetyltransferase